MAYVIVETRLDPPLTDEDRQERMQRLAPCIEQHGLRWIRSFLSNDRRRLVCEYEGPDAESVRTAHRTAGIAFVRVWTAEMLTPESMFVGGD